LYFEAEDGKSPLNLCKRTSSKPRRKKRRNLEP